MTNEIADAEDAKGFALAVAVGHGSVTTMHAGDKDEALARLRTWGVDVDWLCDKAVWIKTALQYVATPDSRIEMRHVVEYAEGVEQKLSSCRA